MIGWLDCDRARRVPRLGRRYIRATLTTSPGPLLVTRCRARARRPRQPRRVPGPAFLLRRRRPPPAMAPRAARASRPRPTPSSGDARRRVPRAGEYDFYSYARAAGELDDEFRPQEGTPKTAASGAAAAAVVAARAAMTSAERRAAQLKQVKISRGFIAALDQSGGSTPRALALYGVSDIRAGDKSEMFDAAHAMRTRIITSEAFDGDKVFGTILFADTAFNRLVRGKCTATYLWEDKDSPVPEDRRRAPAGGERRAAHEGHRRLGRHAEPVRTTRPEARRRRRHECWFEHGEPTCSTTRSHGPRFVYLRDQGEERDPFQRSGRHRRARRAAVRARGDGRGSRAGAHRRARGGHRLQRQGAFVYPLARVSSFLVFFGFGNQPARVRRIASFSYHAVTDASIVPLAQAGAETTLKAALVRHLDILETLAEADGDPPPMIIFKLTLPEDPALYDSLVADPRVLRVVALSGGYDREESTRRLRTCRGMSASFSRALTEGLRVDQSDEEWWRGAGSVDWGDLRGGVHVRGGKRRDATRRERAVDAVELSLHRASQTFSRPQTVEPTAACPFRPQSSARRLRCSSCRRS